MPDFNAMYELYDPMSIMFFFRNKHIMVDLGTGNNNKARWCSVSLWSRKSLGGGRAAHR